MTRLYKRSAELLVTAPSGYFTDGSNVVTIRDLRFTFRVEKTLSSDPNSCELEISNLGESTRAALQTKPLRVALSAGYDDEVKQVFVGDIRWVESMRDEIGWTTKVQAGDGERAHKHARINRSFKRGVKTKELLGEVTKSMGLKTPKNLDDVRELVDQVVNGTALNGPSQKELTRLLRPRGLTWSVQDGVLQVLKPGEARAGAALEVSAETGMIGSPGFGAPPKKGEPAVLTIESLLYPEVTPGGMVRVKSRTANGDFLVTKVSHAGDTHGDEWSSTIKAISISTKKARRYIR